MVRFSESVAIARLAREINMPFQELWALARHEPPVPTRRLVVDGELLQVLGDTLLRENALRQQSEGNSKRLSHLANHDPLTNLPNRLLLADRLSSALALARRHDRRLAVLFLDIDRFKHINDSLGHLLGDELLQVAAREITSCLRRSDTVARQGGDEFVVILSELAHAEDASAAAEKIITALGKPLTVGGQDLHITVSIGISAFPDDGDDAQTLLTCADMALYHAKDQGRNCYQFFKPALNARAVERQSVASGLRKALETSEQPGLSEFELFYQPKIDLKNGDVLGAEALIRWRHPERGLLQPAQFIPFAEECGLIRQIGDWVVREACRQARAWQNAGLGPMPVAVNISAVELQSKDFLQSIVRILAETALEARYLEIELTESVLMANVEATTSALRELRTLGVQLAIDDFGVGCSGLGYLRRFPIDALKIDRSFIQEIPFGVPAVATAVISMAKSLNLRVIAEGVETQEQFDFLRAEECGEGQGFYFSRPLVSQAFTELLKAERDRLGGHAPLHRLETRGRTS